MSSTVSIFKDPASLESTAQQLDNPKRSSKKGLQLRFSPSDSAIKYKTLLLLQLKDALIHSPLSNETNSSNRTELAYTRKLDMTGVRSE